LGLPVPLPPEEPARGSEVAAAAADSEDGATAELSTDDLITMMRTVLSRRIALMMKRPMKDGMKEVTLLNSAQRALTRLVVMESARKPTARSKAAVAEMDDLRKKIAARIDQLNQG
jgi:hypothetical protein